MLKVVGKYELKNQAPTLPAPARAWAGSQPLCTALSQSFTGAEQQPLCLSLNSAGIGMSSAFLSYYLGSTWVQLPR